MTEPVEIRVTGELRHLAESNMWEASAYGGGSAADGIPSFEVRVEADTEDAVKALFIVEWNDRASTTWTDDQFVWRYNEG